MNLAFVVTGEKLMMRKEEGRWICGAVLMEISEGMLG